MTAPAIECAPMEANTRRAAFELLSGFLYNDPHYLESRATYGDGGPAALDRALALFLARPETGLVWLAHDRSDQRPVGACVVCYAISTARGSLVAKLDDVTVRADAHGMGVGTAMLIALCGWLRARSVTRIDCACRRSNARAWRFYERLDFKPLDEERITLLLD
jgi:ribosomal protein S18 acetylase RimI-like enzyme